MSDRERHDGLKNPMRFSIKNRRIDIGEKLRHPDFDDKQVTEIEIQDGQLYVHWEWQTGTDRCRLCGDPIESPRLTADSHPKGPNHLVGQCCVYERAEQDGGSE